MPLKLRTKGYRRLTNPAPILTQKFNNNQIVVEFSKKNWSDSWHKVGFVRAVIRDGTKWIQLGRPVPVIFGKQTVTLDVNPIEEYQIQIVLVPWIPWVLVQLWEVIPE